MLETLLQTVIFLSWWRVSDRDFLAFPWPGWPGLMDFICVDLHSPQERDFSELYTTSASAASSEREQLPSETNSPDIFKARI